MLVDESKSMVRVSLGAVLGAVGATGAFFIFAVGKGLLAQQSKVTTGWEGVVGLEGVARTELNPEGQVFVDGSLWTAVAEGQPLYRGEPVEVVRVDGLRLTVRRKDAAAEEAGEESTEG